MIRWTTPAIGSGAWTSVPEADEWVKIDVRDLVDRVGNTAELIRSKLDEARRHRGNGLKVVFCCDYGMSRSNALVAGLLAEEEGITLNEAIQKVLAATHETEIQLGVLNAVRDAIEVIDGPAPLSEAGQRRILITGASGLLGTGLASQLDGADIVSEPSRRSVDLLSGATELDLYVKDQRIDTLVHLAHPRIFTTNAALGPALVMLKNVLDVCADNELHLVYPSCWTVYSGYLDSPLTASEDTRLKPHGTFGQTKELCETLIKRKLEEVDFSCTMLRFSPVYGQNADRPRFLQHYRSKIVGQQPIVVHTYDNGHPALDLLHVRDAQAAIRLAIGLRRNEVFNIGTGVLTTTTEIAEAMRALAQSNQEVSHLKLSGPSPHIAMDSKRADVLLGWRPTIAVVEGLKDLFANHATQEGS